MQTRLREHNAQKHPAMPMQRRSLPPRNLHTLPHERLSAREIDYVQRWLAAGRIKPQLETPAPAAREEQEAESIADQVTQATQPAAPVIDRAADASANARESVSESELQKITQEPGASLPESEARFLAPRFGADLSHVRLHTGPQASNLARSIRARAFTADAHIFFARGEYRPGTAEGRRLLAHEITHTFQSGAARTIRRQTTPGPWQPPGRMPIPFYLGTDAHRGIAAHYSRMHANGNRIFINDVPVITILRFLRTQGIAVRENALAVSEKALRPDILNVTRRHLYEIKPKGAQQFGALKAQLYQSIFARAGFAVDLGSVAEPGTMGVVSAPGGWFVFWCDEPGVIVYQRVPQPIEQPEKLPVPENRREPWLDHEFMKKMERFTGLTGMALLIYIIFVSGLSRLIPPRNLLPVP